MRSIQPIIESKLKMKGLVKNSLLEQPLENKRKPQDVAIQLSTLHYVRRLLECGPR